MSVVLRSLYLLVFLYDGGAHDGKRVGKRTIRKEMERDVRVVVLAKVGKRADSEGGEARCSRCL